MPAATNWLLDRIPTEAFVVTDMQPDGTLAPIPPDLQPRAGLEIAHWWARSLARAWIAHARALLARVVADGAAGAPEHLWKVFAAIANAYNALNVPWYMHPTARSLFRTYMAGPPQRAAGDPLGLHAKFDDKWNYSRYIPTNPGDYTDGWYRPMQGGEARASDARRGTGANEVSYPIGTSFRGEIPQAGRLLFVQNYPRGQVKALGHPNNFVAWVDMDLAVPADAQYQPNVVRVAYQMEVINVLYPFATVVAEMTSMNACRMIGPGYAGGTPLPDGGDCGGKLPGMRTFGFDVTPAVGDLEFSTSEGLRMATPMANYVAWAQAWLDALAQETPEQVVVTTRFYTTYVNAMQQRYTDGFGDAVRLVDAQVAIQQRTPDRNVGRIATGITGIGGVIAVAAPGVGTVIGGVLAVIGTAITLFDALSNHGTTGKFKDDLGRYKPTFERSSLGGDPLVTDTTGRPGFFVPAPPPPPRAPGSTITGLAPDALAELQAAIGTDLSNATVAPVADLRFGDRASSGGAPPVALLHRPIVGLALGFAVGLVCVRIATS